MARLQHRPWVQTAAVATLAAYIRLVDRTGRFQLRVDPRTVDLIKARCGLIGAFWHGRMMMMEPAWRRLLAEAKVADPLRPCVISSDHADAVLAGRVMGRLGVDVLHGSNKRGGLSIYRQTLRMLESGRIVVMTPDGPRGPARQVKPGIVRLAQRAEIPIIPVSFSTDRAKRLRSWDSFVVPLPFARGIMAFGAPIVVARDDDPERVRIEVGRALDRLSEEVDRGLPDLAPAPLA